MKVYIIRDPETGIIYGNDMYSENTSGKPTIMMKKHTATGLITRQKKACENYTDKTKLFWYRVEVVECELVIPERQS